MKRDVILAGVGGQGILSIAKVIGYAALKQELYLKQAEVHGMSQRGGDVQSHLRISHKPVWSDLIPHGKADLILSLEPLEALRYLPYLSPDGWIITNSTHFTNISNYPDIDRILNDIRRVKNHRIIDADRIAKETGSPRSVNMVMLGAAVKQLGLPPEDLKEGLRDLFKKKHDKIIENNLKAFDWGMKN
jgi:indolepyruvate ferredoxin oxidoreductase, beta subunit